MRPAFFLDRDGVLNDAPVVGGTALSPRALADLHVLPGVVDAVADLRRAGFLAVVVTNQPDIARGRVSAEAVDAMHDQLRDELHVDAVYVCPHDGAEGCGCRKPADGMLRDAAADLSIDLAASWMVGDRWVDIAAGRAAGVRTILVQRDYSWGATSAGSPPADLEPDVRARDLAEAVRVAVGNGAG